MATIHNVALPALLQHEIPPTVDELISEIDPWVLYQLKSLVSSDVHYENQLYGPVITFISSIFLTRRRFMTIPQALMRRSLDASDVDEDLGNISIGSTGGLHESRDLPGCEVDKFVPDFLTVKVLPMPPPARSYTMVCLIEVKRDGLTIAQTAEQMVKYMERALEHGSISDDFQGYLILGKNVAVFGYVMGEGQKIVDIIGEFSMLDASDPFTRGLSEIAINNRDPYVKGIIHFVCLSYK